ncbi:class I SAM-dependent methyltransferase [Roseiflexus sp.]|uniref:class I SAM-dependent methyltransferase n=1 Tax=Roseiflexus sp. TaxID=2562120 RepID=UPI0021DE1AC7|nr:class I SAM-dependent methyltransferase [Roseiflexus sp.]GIV99723.1 MAG: ubiquinone biosynthesis protein UbiE [Roseiflexus sp.]
MVRNGSAGSMGWREEQAFFDRLADSWDAMARPETLARLTDIITGLGLSSGARVLDVGCGTGVLFALLRSCIGDQGLLIGLDVSRRMLDYAVARGDADLCIQADAENPPLCDRMFDWIICNAVLPHFTDKAATLRALCRCLAPHGTLVICHANSREMINAIHRRAGGAVADDRLPDPATLTTLLLQSGLSPVHTLDGIDRYVMIARPMIAR